MSSGTSSSTLSLTTPAQYLKGVGPNRAELLARLGLRTARDILFLFPRDYQDMSELRAIERLEEGQTVSVTGVVDEVDLRNTGPGRCVVGVLIRQGTHYLRAVWFNQPFMRDRFKFGDRVLFSGRAKLQGIRWEMSHPRVQKLGSDEEPPQGRILPSYSLTEGLKQTQMRRIVHAVVDSHLGLVDEVLPPAFREAHRLASIQEALREIHLPSGKSELRFAQRRLIFQELLVMQLALAYRKSRLLREHQAKSLPATAKIDARIRRLFPFELTDDQNVAIREIAEDLGRGFPMNRLLQGDVGSGKTVVAQYAMLLAVAQGQQAVLMAPTDILARQHARTFAKSLQHSRAKIGLLTGSITAAERRSVLADIASGEVNLVIGTHAVLNESVEFQNLGLVVIDEQHKFGVRQRAQLRRAGMDPHYLIMTATPIPRTIAMSMFGDLDVSTIRQGPPNRQPVHTYLGDEQRRKQWWEFFRKKLQEGRQGYVITPLVDESTLLPLASVEEAFENLSNGELEAFRLDLVHGQQSAEEKDASMRAFSAGETQVLVATSVVEVGVDVPNATVMTIENGERFGLAQLHQLRGRISRGSHPGYLCVFANAPSEEAARRLKAFSRSTDGFELAELDFQIRGPGNLFGLKQHGLPPFWIADLQRDQETLIEARTVAQALIEEDPNLSAPELDKLRRMVFARYGQALELGDVG